VRLLANIGGTTHVVELDEGNDTGLVRVKVDEREYLIDITSPTPGFYSLVVHGMVFNAFVWSRRGRRDVQIGNWSVGVEVASAQSQRPSAKVAATVTGRQEITAPMSGRVVEVLVQPGQTVQDGERLVIIEAMKMETEIRAVARGQVKDIQVSADMAVEAGQLLLVLEGS
jgi:glutaconyl-CoA/methylmalonyl-CoA decarboxylase subunit gamma